MGLIQGSVQNGSDYRRAFIYYHITQNTVENYSTITIEVLVDSTKYNTWNGTVNNANDNIDGSTKDYEPFNNSNVQSWSYTNENSPTGIMAQILWTRTEKIYHDNDGKKKLWLSAYCDFQSGGFGPGIVNVGGYVDLPQIKRASQFTLSKTIFYAGEQIKISIQKSEMVNYHKIYLKIDSSKELLSTNVDEEYIWNTENLYSKMTEAKKINAVIVVESLNINNEFIGESSKIFIALINNANPIFEDFNFGDSNTKTLSLTGDSTKLIKGYSNIFATVLTSQKAQPQKSAIIKKYSFVCGDKQTEKEYSNTQNVTMNIKEAVNPVLTVYAIDSRENSTSVQKVMTLIDYTNIFITKFNVERQNGGTNSKVFLNCEGEFCNIFFGAKQNSLKRISYRYRKNEKSVWVDGTTSLNYTTEQNKFLISQEISGDKNADGFDINESFFIEITIADELSSATSEVTFSAGSPAVDIYKNCIALGGSYNEIEGGRVQIEGKSINSLLNINSATAYLNDDPYLVSSPSPYYERKIALQTFKTNTSKFSLYSGGIKINENLSKILVCGNLVNCNLGDGDVVINKKTTDENGTSINVELATCPMGCSISCDAAIGYSISPKICDVKKDDVIYLNVSLANKVSSKSVQGLGRTYLTVIEIE